MNDDLSSRIESMRRRLQTVGQSILRRVARARDMDQIPECSPEAFLVQSPDITCHIMVCRGSGGGTYAEIAMPMREKGVRAASS